MTDHLTTSSPSPPQPPAGDQVRPEPLQATLDGGSAAALPAQPWGTRAWAFFAVAALLFGVGLWQQRHFFHDDSYVPLRYAERLLAGQGLTWNDGERVEGFSSPAWLFQVALLGGLGVPLPLAARMLGIAYATAVLALWYRARGDPAGLLALVSLQGFTLWAWGGLETMAVCFWILVGLVLVMRLREDPGSFRRGFLLGLSLTAIALSRPEGMAVSLCFLCAAWPGHRNPHARAAACGLLLAFASYEVFRLAYFGDWLANGARAKTLGLALGPQMAGASLYLSTTAPLWLGSMLLAGWMLVWSPARWRAGWLLLPIAPLLLAVVAAGGDHMLGARFMLAPVAVMCFVAGLAPPSQRGWVQRTVTVLAVFCALWQFEFVWRYPAAPDPAAAEGEVVGRSLETRLPAKTLVAAATAGSVPYFASSLSFIDTLGLNDRHIARRAPVGLPPAVDRSGGWFSVPGHLRGDGDYVLSRQPEVVMLGGAKGDLLPWFRGDYQLVTTRTFQQSYAPWRLLAAIPPSSRPWLANQLDTESGRLPITLYVRRDSPAWAVVAREGRPLVPPWEKGP